MWAIVTKEDISVFEIRKKYNKHFFFLFFFTHLCLQLTCWIGREVQPVKLSLCLQVANSQFLVFHLTKCMYPKNIKSMILVLSKPTLY